MRRTGPGLYAAVRHLVRRRFTCVLGILLLGGLLAPAASWRAEGPPVRSLARGGYTLVFSEGYGPEAHEVAAAVSEGRKQVEAFFGHHYPLPFTVRLFGSRAALTDRWRFAWGVPDLVSECWMVASGTATSLDLLAPSTWKTEACDHDPSDTRATRQLIAHELVHVFHGQHNPSPEFDGLDGIAWFVEGLAVLASGQLDEGRLASARRAVAEGRGPKALSEAWAGKDRYGVAGSLVAYVERIHGRAFLFTLLKCTSQDAILHAMGTSEEAFLSAWREDLLGAAKDGTRG